MNAEVETMSFCTGFGQRDTHADDLADGRVNPHSSAGTPYGTIRAREIVAMVRNPPSVPKDRAQWFIPSTYAASDARDFSIQREHGLFWWLVVDVDNGSPSMAEMRAAVAAVIGEAAYLIYASRSATEEDRRWRVLIPLAAPVAGAGYLDTALALFHLLEAHGLTCDSRVGLPAQLVYLPNRGAYYDHAVNKGPRLALEPSHPIVRRLESERARRAEAEAEAQAAREKRAAERAQRAATGEMSPVDHFNAHHDLEQLLGRYGYRQFKGTSDWRSPFQTSRTYATRCFGDYWTSLSGSDTDAGLGRETRQGFRFGDAFDLFVHFEHGGDFTAAVRSYAEEAGLGYAPSWAPGDDFAQAGPRTEMGDPDDRPDLSHDHLALDLGVRSWDRDARHVALWGKWLFWEGAHSRRDETLDHLTRCRAYLRERATEVAQWAEHKKGELAATDEERGERLVRWAKNQAKVLRSKATVSAVADLARANPAAAVTHEAFDRDLLLVGTPGGTVDLRTGKMRPARREDMISRLTAVTPAPPGTRPETWLRVLAEIFAGDAAVIGFMQRAAGYALTGSTAEHKLLFLHGSGRNGKSVFLNTLLDLWGDYGRRVAATTFLNATTERHPTDIAGLQGARLAIASELPRGKTWDEATIKDLTGGDRMTARFMRQDFFEFDPQLTLMIAGNTQPSFRGVDEAIRARVVLVPFTVTIPPERRDTTLPAKLWAEGPAILRWAIEGALAWQERGLDVPATIAAASAAYFDDEDTLGQFLEEECVLEVGAFTTTEDLALRFNFWCERQGLNAWTRRTLVKELKQRGFGDAKSNGRRGLRGLKLR